MSIRWSGHSETTKSLANVPTEMRLYDRLVVEAYPEAGGKDFVENVNLNSLKVLNGVLKPSLAAARQTTNFSLSGTGTLWLIEWTIRLKSWCLTWQWG